MHRWLRPLLLGLVLGLAGCSSVEYAVKERFGIHKRDILVARVHDARQAQDAARQQFANALEQFLAVTGNNGGPLAERYGKLQHELARSESRAASVRARIGEIEQVSHALFREWRRELDTYKDPALREASRRQFATTEQRYAALAAALNRAAAMMDPVLDRFRDQVLFLKHNLNASAIAQLDSNHRQLELEIGDLIH
ncbi:MAG TPA: DUF2959 family protein, partial [Opitutaceae bacterium]|nr:DUF2959 family protein [Opitutaceae bacterium]